MVGGGPLMSRSTPPPGARASIGKLATSVLSLAQTRLEIFGIEMAEEKERLLSTLLLAVFALMIGMLALVAVTALIVIVFWDSYRWQPLALLSALYVLSALFAALRIRHVIRHAPPPFEATRAEFENDRILFEQHRAQREED
jgi:uncharacterized membrane protein YqjE